MQALSNIKIEILLEDKWYDVVNINMRKKTVTIISYNTTMLETLLIVDFYKIDKVVITHQDDIKSTVEDICQT